MWNKGLRPPLLLSFMPCISDLDTRSFLVPDDQGYLTAQNKSIMQITIYQSKLFSCPEVELNLITQVFATNYLSYYWYFPLYFSTWNYSFTFYTAFINEMATVHVLYFYYNGALRINRSLGNIRRQQYYKWHVTLKGGCGTNFAFGPTSFKLHICSWVSNVLSSHKRNNFFLNKKLE